LKYEVKNWFQRSLSKSTCLYRYAMKGPGPKDAALEEVAKINAVEILGA
jgi:hypothetical protein